jgi:hypothetical protein
MYKIILFIFFPVSLFSQSTYFEKIYGTPGDDYSRSVKQIATGSIYVLGNSDSGTIGSGDISLSKLDKHGNLLWTNYYGTTNKENGFFLNVTNDGNFVFVAESESSSNNLDILIFKVDTAGAEIWNKSFASPVNETPKYVEQTSDGGYIICGAQNDSMGYYDILALKLDAAGDYQWHQTYGRNNNEYSDMIHEIPTGYILTADTKSYGAGGYDIILYSTDPSGNEIWSQTYGDSLQNGCQGLLITSDRHYLSYGETEISPFSFFDFYLEKIDSTGNSVWRYTYGGLYADAIFSVREDADGGFICTGYSNSYNGGGPLDLVILKVDQAGNFMWKETYGGAGVDIGFELIKSVDNDGFIITGKTTTTSEEYYLLKLDNNGIIGIPTAKNNSKSLNLFPNPASAKFFINFESLNSQNYDVLIYDLPGKLIMKKKLSGNFLKEGIDISEINPGIYFCNVIMDGKITGTEKLIIVR